MKRLCPCGILFDAGKPFLHKCPWCGACEAARIIEAAQQDINVDVDPLLRALGEVINAVVEWPHILIEGDQPGACVDCGRRTERRWDGVCGTCLDLMADQAQAAAGGHDYPSWDDNHPLTYGGKHGT